LRKRKEGLIARRKGDKRRKKTARFGVVRKGKPAKKEGPPGRDLIMKKEPKPIPTSERIWNLGKQEELLEEARGNRRASSF